MDHLGLVVDERRIDDVRLRGVHIVPERDWTIPRWARAASPEMRRSYIRVHHPVS
jgi:hypothetical protein